MQIQDLGGEAHLSPAFVYLDEKPVGRISGLAHRNVYRREHAAPANSGIVKADNVVHQAQKMAHYSPLKHLESGLPAPKVAA